MSTVRIVGALLVLAAVLAGCSSTDAAASGPDADGLEVVRGTPLGEIQAEPAAGTIKLWVSNQSFGEDPVRLTVRIGDTTVVDDSFEVLGQHNWIAFDMSGLAPGSHTLRVVSDTGAEDAMVFDLSATAPKWLLVDYWYDADEDGERHFTLRSSDEQILFN
jgi:hypothetical protein